MSLYNRGGFLRLFSWFMVFAHIHLSIAVAAPIDEQIKVHSGSTYIDKAQNGVPVVNLSAPTSKGVSVNRFDIYNVGSDGLILNNSVSGGSSVLGGRLYGNPNYQRSGRSAGIVVNEVKGNSRSELMGASEMFGKSAEFVLVNPNGIYVNGASFINMPRVTLGAGTGVYNNGNFKGIDVENGGVEIDGSGVYAKEIDSFDIVSRRVHINAPVYANNFSVNTGNGHYDYASKSLDKSESIGNPADFEYAIDVSALGDIAAGRIYLISNENGVGVRSVSDSLRADVSDIEIRSDGQVELKNAFASGKVNIEASGVIDTGGEVLGMRGVSLKGESIENEGELLSGKDMSLEASGVKNSGGLIFSSGNMQAEFDRLDNSYGDIYSMKDMSLFGSGAKLVNYSGSIESEGDMSIELGSSGSLLNTGKDSGGYTAELVHIGGYTRDSYGLMDEQRIESSMTTDSSYIDSGGNMNIVTGDIVNRGSVISSSGDLNIVSDKTLNETSFVDVYFDEYQHFGRVKRVHKQFGPVRWGYRDEKSDYWTSGSLRAESADKGMILSGGDLALSDNTGVKSEVSGNGILENGRVNDVGVSRNTSRIDDILESNGVNISRYASIDENGSPIFKVNKDFGSPYLIETRFEFIDKGSFYGSSYFLDRVDYAPESVKFLGDAFYEEKAVSEAIMKSSSRRFLFEDIDSDTEQMKRLLDNAVSAYKELELAVGVELSREQITLLQEPIIWYVTEDIMGETVLSPRLYIPDSLLSGFSYQGDTISGDNVHIESNAVNSGRISANGDLSIQGGDISNNEGGTVQGYDVSLSASGNIKNTGGVISAENDLVMVTREGSVTNETLVHSKEHGKGNIVSELGDKAVISAGGALILSSGSDFVNTGSDVISGGDMDISADGNIDFKAASVTNRTSYGGLRKSGFEETTALSGSSLNAGGDLNMRSGVNTVFEASSAVVSGEALIETGGSLSLLNGYESSVSDISSKGGTWGVSSSKRDVNIEKTAAGSSFNTGGDMYVSSLGDINVTGSSIDSGGDVYLASSGDINVKAANDYSESSSSSKRNNNGLSKKGSDDRVIDEQAVSSEIKAGNNFISLSGADTSIEGSKIEAADTVNIEAVGNVNIKAAYESHEESHSKTSSGVGQGGGTYGARIEASGRGSTEASGSSVDASSVYIKSGADTLLEGSAIQSYYTDIVTGGNFLETAAQVSSYEYSIKKKMNLSFDLSSLVNAHNGYFLDFKNTILKDLKDMFMKGERISIDIMSGSYSESSTRTEVEGLYGSIINASILNVSSGGDIDVKASDIFAHDSASLSAGGDVNIGSMDVTESTKSKEFEGKASLSLGVSHTAGAAYKAGDELQNSVETLDNARKAYDNYKYEIKPKADEDYAAGLIDNEEYEFIKSLDKYYELNIALCTENVAAKTMNMVSAVGSAGASLGTLGFAFDATVEVDGKGKETNSFSSTAVGSNVYGAKNLVIKAGGELNALGSVVGQGIVGTEGEGENKQNVYALSENTSIEAQRVNIEASENSYNSNERENHANMSVSYGTRISGVNVSGDAHRVESEGVSYTNSFVGGDNVSIKSAGDVIVSGSNVRADNKLVLVSGGNLKTESLQDEAYKDESYVGMNFKGGTDVSAGADIKISESSRKWVGEQSSITSGGRLEADIAGKTELIGGLIASDDKDMSFSTGSLEFSDVKDRERSYSVQLGASFGIEGIGKQGEAAGSDANKDKPADNKVAAASSDGANKTAVSSKNPKMGANPNGELGADYEFGYGMQTNFATIGEGDIIVKDGGGIEGLNRDTDKAQYVTLAPVQIAGGFEVNDNILNPKDTAERAWDETKYGITEFMILYGKSKNIAKEGLKEGLEEGLEILEKINIFETEEEKAARLLREKNQEIYNKIMQGLTETNKQVKDLPADKLTELFNAMQVLVKDSVSEAELKKAIPLYDKFIQEVDDLYADIQKNSNMKGKRQIYQGELGGSAAATGCVFTSMYMAAWLLGIAAMPFKAAWEVCITKMIPSTDDKGNLIYISIAEPSNANVNSRYDVIYTMSNYGVIMSNTYPFRKNGITPITSEHTIQDASNVMVKGFDEGNSVYLLRTGKQGNEGGRHTVVATGYYHDLRGNLIFTISDPAGGSNTYTHFDTGNNLFFKNGPKGREYKDETIVYYDIVTKKGGTKK